MSPAPSRPSRRFPRGALYAITPEELRGRSLVDAVQQALAGGARLVQYRDKTADRERRRSEALALRAACRQHGGLFIVNDDVELAAAVGADGAHLGRDDPALSAARAALGPEAIVGVSCYNELERAVEAERAGASYVAFGSFYPSPTKPSAVRATPELVRTAREIISLPIVAIGGITVENAAPLLAAGVDALAVVTALFDTPDVTAAARAFVKALERKDAR